MGNGIKTPWQVGRLLAAEVFPKPIIFFPLPQLSTRFAADEKNTSILIFSMFFKVPQKVALNNRVE